MSFLEIDGCPIHYRLEGETGRPVLVLSNSLGTTLDMWEPQMPGLLRHFRVLRYDSRGHGASGVTPGPYDIGRLGRDALGLLDGLGLDRVAWCGVSKGGMVGMWLAAHHGARIAKAVFANTAAHLGPRELWDQRIATVRAKGMEAIADAVVARWFTPDFAARAPEAVAPMRARLAGLSVEGYTACCAAVRDMDQRADLARIECPVLVVVGTRDQATPPALGEAIAAAVPDARVVDIEAAHISNIEQPGRFTAALLDFLT